MEFDLGGEQVTLLQFTPLSTSDTYYGCSYTDSHTNAHSSARRWDASPSYGNLRQSYNTPEVADLMPGVSSMDVSATPSPIPPPAPAPATAQSLQQHSPYFSSTDSYTAMQTAEPQACQSPYYRNQQYNDYIHSPQMASPAVSVTNTGYDSPTVDLESIEMLFNDPIGGADMGPQPIRLPRLEEEPPRTKESAYSSNLLVSKHEVRSTPHSPSDMRSRSDTLKASRRGRSVSSSKNSRGTIKRSSSPVFPDYSTPLSSVSLSRHPSITSLCSSTKSDPFTIAASVRSDPGPYRIQHSSGDSAIDSPATSLQNSPKFVFNSSSSSTQNSPVSIDNSSRSCIEISMPVRLAKKITEVDKKIWRLQAERSKLLERAQQTKSVGPLDGIQDGHFESRLLSEKSSEIGKVHLYVFPLGIHALDEPIYEEANAILRQVGGLYFDYQSAVDNLRSICCKGMVHLPDMSTCFAYIKSLLNDNQKLKLVNSIGGMYRIQLDLEESALGQADGIVPTEFVESLRVANEVMRCAQQITKVYPTVHMQLQQVRQMTAAKYDQCDSICQDLRIMDRERRTQIKSVLDGNCTIMASAERVWPQYYQIATETIRTITGCIHPTT